MAATPRGKKLLKITGIVTGCLLILLLGFHIWFRAHARHLLEDLVAKRSNGKVNMKLGKLRFGYFSNKMELEDAVFFNTDSVDNNTAYRFSVKEIRLEVKALWPVLFKNEFLIDSLSLFAPDIVVTRLREGRKDTARVKDISIPAEMGKVYNSIRDALKVLKVSSFRITEGRFTLVNKVNTEELPITISHLDLHIDNFQVDTSITDPTGKILFSDNIVLGSRNQDILFPDGRHRLSFRNFNINLREKIVRFDSCTIAATRTDSANASFHVYLDTLLLSNIDFDTLYHSDLIKADSVYCVNPKFTLDVELGKRKEPGRQAPRLENIIKQLTGDLELAHVVVTNAEFNIKTVRDGVPNSFVFTQNNFAMEGLHIRQDAPKPIQVKNFVMAIRNYENFIRDSTYSILFDSILLRDDRIILSNFVFNKLQNGKITNSLRIPQFNLQGLSWDDLVFDRRLRAEQAIMFNPLINYSFSTPEKNRNIFQVLGAVNDMMDLQYLDVIDGRIDLRVNDSLRIQLDSATLAIQSHSLLTSKRLASIKNSLTRLYFKRGRIRAGNLDISLDNIRYIGNTGQLEAGTMQITDDEKNLDINLVATTVEKMRVDEASGNIYAQGLNWRSGSVKFTTNRGTGSKPVSILLQDVKGMNTLFEAYLGGMRITTQIENLNFSQFIKSPGNKPELKGIALTGKDLSLAKKGFHLDVGEYQVADNEKSFLANAKFGLQSATTNAEVYAPRVVLTPRMEALLNGHLRSDDIVLEKPEIKLGFSPLARGASTASHPEIDINTIRFIQPKFSYSLVRDSGTLSITWNGNEDPRSYLAIAGLHADSGANLVLSSKELDFHLSRFNAVGIKGRKFSTGNGSVSARLHNLDFVKEINLPAEWKANIVQLDAQSLELDSIGKRNGRLELAAAAITDLNISTTRVINLRRMISDNRTFRLSGLTGSYSDDKLKGRWHNAGFSRTTNMFSLDSASFSPSVSRDSFMAAREYQADFVDLRTGGIRIGPVDADMYGNSGTLKVGIVEINDAMIDSYRDKNLPRKETGATPLPGTMIRRIPFPLSVDTLRLHNTNIVYTEVNPELGTTTIVPVNHLEGTVYPIRNTGLQTQDSLHIYAEAKILDTLAVSLRVKESYNDSMQGFHMQVKMRPVDLRVLNPVLEPATRVQLRSGYLDSLSMRVTGREALAFGEIDFHYHDLKVKVLPKAGENRKRGFLSFIVNSFIVKNKNRKTGTAFYVRDRQRSAINYLVRILMSGITNSVGAKNHKKEMRPYAKEISSTALPGE